MMRAVVLALVGLLMSACASGVAGPPERPSCFAVCLAEMHADFAASCAQGSTSPACVDHGVRDAIVGRASDCMRACP